MMEAMLQSSGVFRNEEQIVDKVLGVMENILVDSEFFDLYTEVDNCRSLF